jgi:uncharacterized protein YqiB (DUF1249 family)
MTELEVFRLLLARRENYGISEIVPISGRTYSLTMKQTAYTAIIVTNSFDFYQLRYHLAKHVPTLIICFSHDSVVPVTCLSLKAGRIALPYDLPAHIRNVEQQRHGSKVGSQVLLGMYLCGMQDAQKLVNKLPDRTRRRYLQRARELSNRKPGRPVNSQRAQSKVS